MFWINSSQTRSYICKQIHLHWWNRVTDLRDKAAGPWHLWSPFLPVGSIQSPFPPHPCSFLLIRTKATQTQLDRCKPPKELHIPGSWTTVKTKILPEARITALGCWAWNRLSVWLHERPAARSKGSSATSPLSRNTCSLSGFIYSGCHQSKEWKIAWAVWGGGEERGRRGKRKERNSWDKEFELHSVAEGKLLGNSLSERSEPLQRVA